MNDVKFFMGIIAAIIIIAAGVIGAILYFQSMDRQLLNNERMACINAGMQVVDGHCLYGKALEKSQ